MYLHKNRISTVSILVVFHLHHQIKDKLNRDFPARLKEIFSKCMLGPKPTSDKEPVTARWIEKGTWKLSKRRRVLPYDMDPQRGPRNNSTLWSTFCERRKKQHTETITHNSILNRYRWRVWRCVWGTGESRGVWGMARWELKRLS